MFMFYRVVLYIIIGFQIQERRHILLLPKKLKYDYVVRS